MLTPGDVAVARRSLPPVPALPDPLEQLTLAELRTRTSTKWREHPPEVLPLWVAEMDVPLAEPVQRVLHDAVARSDTGYPAGTGYAEALAAFAAERWAWHDVDVARTALVADVMVGVVEALRLLTAPGDTVVVSCPVYPPFYGFLEAAGLHVHEAPLGADGRLDLEVLGAAMAGPATAYLLCNPHNPTGTVHTAQELAAVAALAAEHRVRVVSDEIHAPLVLPGARFVPYASVAEDGLAVLSATKGWNLAGLKAALLVAGPAAADDLSRLPEVVTHGPSHLGVLGHTAAFAEGGPWLDALLDRPRRQAPPAARPARRAPARRPLDAAGSDLPRLARLPGPRPDRRGRGVRPRSRDLDRRPGRGVPARGARRRERRACLRRGRRGPRAPQLRDLARGPRAGAQPDGPGRSRVTAATTCA